MKKRLNPERLMLIVLALLFWTIGDAFGESHKKSLVTVWKDVHSFISNKNSEAGILFVKSDENNRWINIVLIDGKVYKAVAGNETKSPRLVELHELVKGKSEYSVFFIEKRHRSFKKLILVNPDDPDDCHGRYGKLLGWVKDILASDDLVYFRQVGNIKLDKNANTGAVHGSSEIFITKLSAEIVKKNKPGIFNRAWNWVKDHRDTIVTVVGTIATAAIGVHYSGQIGDCVKWIASNTSNLFSNVINSTNYQPPLDDAPGPIVSNSDDIDNHTKTIDEAAETINKAESSETMDKLEFGEKFCKDMNDNKRAAIAQIRDLYEHPEKIKEMSKYDGWSLAIVCYWIIHSLKDHYPDLDRNAIGQEL
ncbi:MAG: hypothetical protein LBB20_01000, partial [Puniceicoccales bacterium]|nr:hypothetical protein [Puniceicoccales bacterium]